MNTQELNRHLISDTSLVADALQQLNDLGDDLTLFVIDADNRLLGTLTDGDIRRAFLKNITISDKVSQVMNTTFKYLNNKRFSLEDVDQFRKSSVKLLPVLDHDKRIVRVVNFSEQKSMLPLDVVIMAGGEGQRLRPLTEKKPKPLLEVGNKPIIEHGIDRLASYGVNFITISINYLGEQVVEYFGDGSSKKININYVKEENKLGTIGSVSLVDEFHNDHILVMNSDLLTNIDFEEFYREFISKGADMSVACIPYNVNIPYAIIDTDNEHVLGLKEKPTLTYYSNAGIYLIRKEHLSLIPHKGFYNATDLIERLIELQKKVVYYPILGYWLDIGKMDDFNKAQEDFKHIRF